MTLPLDVPLHPILVHFPIALLTTGFLLDAAGLTLKKDWLKRAGLTLLILGTLGAIAARQSGEEAEDAIQETPAIEATLEAHEEGGNFTMWFFVAIAAVRSGLAWWKKFTPAMHWIFLVVWLAGLAALTRTAYLGGELVFRHGAGVGAAATHVERGTEVGRPREND